MEITRFAKHDEHGMPNVFRCDNCGKDFYFAPSYVIPSGMRLVEPYELCEICFHANYKVRAQ